MVRSSRSDESEFGVLIQDWQFYYKGHNSLSVLLGDKLKIRLPMHWKDSLMLLVLLIVQQFLLVALRKYWSPIPFNTISVYLIKKKL